MFVIASKPALGYHVMLEEELRSIVGGANLLLDGDIEERYSADITHKYHSHLGRPAETAQIVAIVKLAGRRGVPISRSAVAPPSSR